jgi:hypothetical protein
MRLAIQFLGAVLILLPFALLQFGRMSRSGYGYLLSNLAGAVALTVVAYLERQWGFVILQAVWAVVSAWGLGQKIGFGKAGG